MGARSYIFIINDSGCRLENKLYHSKRQSRDTHLEAVSKPRGQRMVLGCGCRPGCGERRSDLGCNLKVEPC